MKHKTVTSLVVPTLLILTGIFSYLTLVNKWNFEIASYLIFLFTLVYILVFERIIPLKQEWKSQKNIFWTDIKHFLFSTALFDALGKMAALSLVLFIQKYFFNTSDFWSSQPFLAT